MSDFRNRHIGVTGDAQSVMLGSLGYSSLDELMDAAVPPAIRQEKFLSRIPEAASERETIAELRAIANENTVGRTSRTDMTTRRIEKPT